MARGARISLAVTWILASLALIDLPVTAVERTDVVRVPYLQTRPSPPDTTATVGKGDHLWKIARRHLESVTGSDLTSAQITRYWRTVIEVNIGRLISGDPDLIYPGESIALPEPALIESR